MIYLKNIPNPNDIKEDKDLTIIKCDLEFPFILTPLLIDAENTIRRIMEQPNESDLRKIYFKVQPGIEMLQNVYDVIDKNFDVINQSDPHKYFTAKGKIFDYLQHLPHLYFHLDLSDIYNLSIEDNFKSISDYLSGILKRFEIFRTFIKSSRIKKIVFSPDDNYPQGYHSYKEYLNDRKIEFGWLYFFVNTKEGKGYEIFKMNTFYGLKDPIGNILLPPIYSKINEFNDSGLSVIEKENKFGYIDKKGIIVIAIEWDKAVDMNRNNVGLVSQNGLWGAVDINGNLILSPQYDTVQTTYWNTFFVSQHGKFGLTDHLGKIVVPIQYDDYQFVDSIYVFQVNATKKDDLFNVGFEYVGTFNHDKFDVITKKYIINGKVGQKDVTMIDFKGNEVLKNVQIHNYTISGHSNGLIISKNGKFGIFGEDDGYWLLEPHYDGIKKGTNYTFPDSLFLIQQENQMGIFNATIKQSSWLLPLAEYKTIDLIESSGLFSIKLNKHFKLFSAKDGDVTDYEYDFICSGGAEEKIHAYRDGELFIIEGKKIRPLTLPEVEEQHKYYNNLIGSSKKWFCKFYETFEIKNKRG